MVETQVSTQPRGPYSLRKERLGPLPIINHFLDRVELEAILDKHIPTKDARCTVSHARALGALLRSIVIEREPIYRQGETVGRFAAELFGLGTQTAESLSDDRIGRALDRLFDSDRTALLTEVAVAVGQRFGVKFEEFHNDSTSVSFCGRYRAASGRSIRGKAVPAITYGHSKDHRPDLKQLLFILTMDSDGNVPVHFRCVDGNMSDSRTHIETWNALRAVAGRADFPLRRRFEALFAREHGRNRSRRRALRYGTSADANGGRGVP
jgi:transposase